MIATPGSGDTQVFEGFGFTGWSDVDAIMNLTGWPHIHVPARERLAEVDDPDEPVTAVTPSHSLYQSE